MLDRTLKLAFIDDDELMRDVLSEVFSDDGYEVTPMEMPPEDWNRLDSMFDVVVIDINLVRSDGIEFAKIYRKFGLKTPIVFLTGDPSDKQISRSQEVEDSILLSKGLSFAEIESQIDLFVNLERN